MRRISERTLSGECSTCKRTAHLVLKASFLNTMANNKRVTHFSTTSVVLMNRGLSACHLACRCTRVIAMARVPLLIASLDDWALTARATIR